MLNENNPKELQNLIDEQKNIIANLLTDVKNKMLNSTNKLNSNVNFDTIKQDIDGVRLSDGVTNTDNLKDKLKTLLRNF